MKSMGLGSHLWSRCEQRDDKENRETFAEPSHPDFSTEKVYLYSYNPSTAQVINLITISNTANVTPFTTGDLSE